MDKRLELTVEQKQAVELLKQSIAKCDELDVKFLQDEDAYIYVCNGEHLADIVYPEEEISDDVYEKANRDRKGNVDYVTEDYTNFPCLFQLNTYSAGCGFVPEFDFIFKNE